MGKLPRQLWGSSYPEEMTFLDALAGMMLVWFGYRGFKKGLTGGMLPWEIFFRAGYLFMDMPLLGLHFQLSFSLF